MINSPEPSGLKLISSVKLQLVNKKTLAIASKNCFILKDFNVKQRYVFYLSGLFKITNAAITPGTHPQIHNIKTISIDPQPLSKTAKGGHKIDSKTLQKFI
jgi:hypothetical protein